MKLKRRRAWHAACMGAERNTYIIFIRKLIGLDALDIGVMMNLRDRLGQHKPD
jgi:hypothetical protein